MDDKNFSEQAAREWIETIEGEHSSIREKDLYPILREWIRDVNPVNIVDIGSGQGVCSDKINLEKRFYTGVEPSQFLLNRANQLFGCENRKFIFGNAYELPFASSTFDAAFSVNTWQLLSDQDRAAKELSRVLKHKAKFLIVTANPELISAWASAYKNHSRRGAHFEGFSHDKEGQSSKDDLYFHTCNEIEACLSAHRLTVTSSFCFRKFLCVLGTKC